MKINKVFKRKYYVDYTQRRKGHYTFIMNKYYNIFMNDYDIENVDYQQKDFILRQFWSEGRIACFPLEESKGSSKHPQGLMVFTPFSPTQYNIYDFTIYATPINKKGVPFIPSRPMEVNKEIVIGFCQRNKKSIKFIVDYYANILADIEMVIWINLQVQKTPWLIGVSPESREKMQEIIDKIFDDYAALFVDLEDVQSAKSLISGAPYIIDKLKEYYNQRQNELDEIFGINNLGIMEKKEHLVGEEIRSNNEKTDKYAKCIEDCLLEWEDRVDEVFNYKLGIKRKEVKEELPEDEKEIEDYE